MASFAILPLVLMDRDSGVVSGIESMQNENTGEEVRKVQMRGRIFQETIKIILRRLNTIGALD